MHRRTSALSMRRDCHFKAQSSPGLMIVAGLIAVALCWPPAGLAGPAKLTIGRFAPGSLKNWESKSFKGKTDYQLIGSGPTRTLKASCRDTASAIALRRQIDLTQTPVLHWSWRINGVRKNLDGKKKSGDDYSARIYGIHDGGVFVWRTRAVNYVWANTQPKREQWPNAFTDKAMMVALQSGQPSDRKQWVKESRNVRRDFKRFYGLDLKTLDGVAIMTDCDNSGRPATGYYRNVYFAAH